MKYAIIALTFVHGLIHLIGFSKAFSLASTSILKKEITRLGGVGWLLCALLLTVASFYYWKNKPAWPYLLLAGAVLSQIAIATSWQDARYGSWINALLILIALLQIGTTRFEARFFREASTALANVKDGNEPLMEADLSQLPMPVQNYIRVTGAIGKSKVKSLHLQFEGEMRGQKQDWFSFTSSQYNCFDQPSRFFFMKAKLFGLPVVGYHRFDGGKANMDIRLSGVFPVVKETGRELDVAETVTWFNDVCLFAPAALIDPCIRWQTINDREVTATFTANNSTISAQLFFDNQGLLINFISDDRFDVNRKEKFRFSTPITKYQQMDGILVPTYGETIWHYPEGEFVYGRFTLRNVAYNTADVKR